MRNNFKNIYEINNDKKYTIIFLHGIINVKKGAIDMEDNKKKND